uniref:Uncharacterized protein AlNc14C83G5374 n=1 Tax=Albugo laibachii Nc14 TaxID=890382 RepID=F0WFI9_9STRA|nr:conserved hypothetical protein [Albugo laibachii Nc14]|eukprot:CCA19971.1 conserved hypothetical protein [Albugo laibachii Nc14]
MTKLNPNAGEFVPSFSPVRPKNNAERSPTSVAQRVNETDSTTIILPESYSFGNMKRREQHLRFNASDLALHSTNYSIDFLLQFQSVCDRLPCSLPPLLRSTESKVGCRRNGKLIYTIKELLKFQPLYAMLPAGIDCNETLGAVYRYGKHDSKRRASRERTGRRDRGFSVAAGAQYEANLTCFFNPTEYAAFMSVGNGKHAENYDSIDRQVDTEAICDAFAQEAISARGKMQQLLDDVKAVDVNAFFAHFQEIPISCKETLESVTGELFDRAIAETTQWEGYAQICSYISQKTPEFREGPRTVNFRRIFLTRCYEALVEEETSDQLNALDSKADSASRVHFSWRQQCMIANVCLIGDLFRRQLLTENIIHVSIAMMLENQETLMAHVVEAACGLLNMVGDLLDGLSPASRRTMDEYFDVLQQIQRHPDASSSLLVMISETMLLRANGWLRKRKDSASPNRANVAV